MMNDEERTSEGMRKTSDENRKQAQCRNKIGALASLHNFFQ